jgi:hypothetical protein
LIDRSIRSIRSIPQPEFAERSIDRSRNPHFILATFSESI